MKNYAGEATCGALMAVSTAMQTNEWLQNFQLIVCIIAGILGIILTIWRLIKMYQLAKKDGKITNEERAEMAAEILDLNKQIENLSKVAEKENKDGDNN